VKEIVCEEFDLRLNDGTLFKIICSEEDIDKLIFLIGDSNICQLD